eukprot:scaffold19.g1761.t1
MAVDTDTEAAPSLVNEALLTELNEGKVVASDVGVTIPGVSNPAARRRYLLDLARAAVAGHLHIDKFAVALRAAGVDTEGAAAGDLGAELADVVWYAWVEVEDAGGSAEEARGHCADLAKELLRSQLVSKQRLMEVEEGTLFEEAGLVVSKDQWRKKEIRSNTRRVYQQRRFNLLREESEGYAKLLTLLSAAGAGRVSHASAGAAFAEMRALIGYFDLDPNRCFSLVLDAMTSQPGNEGLLDLVPAFSKEAVNQVTGFHFSRSAVAGRPAPAGLYLAAARLVGGGAMSLEALLAHLSPADAGVREAYAAGTAAVEAAVKRIGIISLTAAPSTGGEPSGMGAANGGMPMRSAGQTAATLELDARPYAAPLTEAAAANQKLGLLAAFVEVGDWPNALRLMAWLRALGVEDLGVFPCVAAALCGMVGRELAPLYAAVDAPAAVAPAGGPLAPAPQLPDALPPRLLEVLSVVGQHLYNDVPVLSRLTRVVAAMLAATPPPAVAQGAAAAAAAPPAARERRQQLMHLLSDHIMPAATLVPSNAGLVNEVWAAVSQLHYTERFCLYADLAEAAKTSPLLTAAAKLAETEVRRILRRVTAPANRREAKATMKPLGRMLAKITHATPLAVSEQLIRQVMGMPGMVTSIVESLKYLTPAALDAMTFVILRQKLKADGVNLEEWFQWLAAFTGLLCKKHPEVEVTALLQYLANQLKGGESLDLLVLKEMVVTMTGTQAVFDVSEHQLDALGGSETLRTEVITQGQHRSSDKSLQRGTQRLIAALQVGPTPEQQLALPLLILLAQQRKLIVLQTQSPHLKLIAELYDKCHETCTQYAEFLQHALGAEEYARLLPSMAELARAREEGGEYLIDPELVFELHRPVIRRLAPPPPPATPAPAPAAAAAVDHEEEGEIQQAQPAGAARGMNGAVGAAAAPAAAAADAAAAAAAEAMDEDGELPSEQSEQTAADASVAAAAAAATAAAHAGAGAGAAAPGAAAAAARWAALEADAAAVGAAGAGFKGLTPALYFTFWSLALYDLEVPVARRAKRRWARGRARERRAQRGPAGFSQRCLLGAWGRARAGAADGDLRALRGCRRYESTIAQLKTNIRISQDDLEAARRDAARGASYQAYPHGGGHFGHGPPPAMGPSIDVDQVEKDIERYQAALAKLPGELKAQQDNAAAVEARLQAGKGAWVGAGAARRAALPREFLQRVHALDVEGFSLLSLINLVMKECGFLVRCCTPREATNLGIFLAELLAILERWRTPDVFARECATKACFKARGAGGAAGGTNFSQQGRERTRGSSCAQNGRKREVQLPRRDHWLAGVTSVKKGAAGPTNVTHKELVNLTHNWQKHLTDTVFKACLVSKDYMQIKNALLLLNRCVYPAVKHDARLLIEMLVPVRDKDPREDIKTLARMYITALEMQMRDRQRNMVATREEYAGLPPKKRPTPRPAASKAAAASAGGAKAATAAKSEGGEAGEPGEVPMLPPGMGVLPSASARTGAVTLDGDAMPPGFGAGSKLAHAASTTDVRAPDKPAAGAAAAGAAGTTEGGRAGAGGERGDRARERERGSRQERGGAAQTSERRAEDAPRQAQQQQQQEQRERVSARGRDAERERSRLGAAALRAEAPAFQPRKRRESEERERGDGTASVGRLSGGSKHGAEAAAAAGGERDAKRPRREEPLQLPPGRRDRPPLPPAAAAAHEERRGVEPPSERERDERREAAKRKRSDEEAAQHRHHSHRHRHEQQEASAGAGAAMAASDRERSERPERSARGSERERERERGAWERDAAQRERERPSSGERARGGEREAAAEGRRDGDREAEVEDARARAAAAHAGERRQRARSPPAEEARGEQQLCDARKAPPSEAGARREAEAAAAAAAEARAREEHEAVADSDSSSERSERQGRHSRKRHKKDKDREKKKKERREKDRDKEREKDKERRHRRKRGKEEAEEGRPQAAPEEAQPARPLPADAGAPESKRPRREEPAAPDSAEGRRGEGGGRRRVVWHPSAEEATADSGRGAERAPVRQRGPVRERGGEPREPPARLQRERGDGEGTRDEGAALPARLRGRLGGPAAAALQQLGGEARPADAPRARQPPEEEERVVREVTRGGPGGGRRGERRRR